MHTIVTTMTFILIIYSIKISEFVHEGNNELNFGLCELIIFLIIFLSDNVRNYFTVLM